MTANRLLLVEDDPVIGEATAEHCRRHGWDVTWLRDGLEAWETFAAAHGADTAYDALLCDVMLPGLDGVTVTRRVRELSTVPVVLLSARSDAVDVVGGLEAGADDYVTKPFDVQVLMARLRGVVRRAGGPSATLAPPGGEEQERFGDLELDRRAVELRRGGDTLRLTPTEMRLFLELADEAGTVLSRRALLDRVWGHDDVGDDHLVDVHLQRLRSKVGADRIETVRGFGYRLVP